TTTGPSWAPPPATAGCPSTEVSPGPVTASPGAHGCPRHHPNPFPPALAAPNLCDLNCLAEGHNFYYSFGRVLDGTRCGPGSPDLCVGGRCLSVGCDGILGSGSRPDACGHCGSGHGSCVLVHRLFQGSDPSSGYLGYVNVTKIPAGATHIKVTDKSRNYLGRTQSQSVPVPRSWPRLVPAVCAGRAGQGRAGVAVSRHALPCLSHVCPMPCRAAPSLGCCFEHRGVSELASARGNFPEAAAAFWEG
ncbi:ATL5 protein, partial [Vidua chalybeata]|nr:ATL5 protein [Vidua chalybeata]